MEMKDLVFMAGGRELKKLRERIQFYLVNGFYINTLHCAAFVDRIFRRHSWT